MSSLPEAKQFAHNWIDQNRRLSTDDERLCETTETWSYLAMTRLMLRRLTAK